MTDDSGEKAMIRLALSFPCMRSKLINTHLMGWNVERLVIASEGWSPSEKLVVAFLATVWDSGQTLTRPFNPVEAYQRWDRDNWDAFQAWVLTPFYC